MTPRTDEAGAPADPDALFPEELNSFRRDVTERQQHPRPHECRNEVRNLESPERHLENTGDQRYRSAQRAGEAPDEDPQRAPFPDERLAARNEVRVLRQRPDVLNPVFELET